MPRFYCPAALISGELLELPASAARHVQVLRLQPGDCITLFNGGFLIQSGGGEFDATITKMGRSAVQVRVGDHHPVEREASHTVHLTIGMPANDRMDWLVEKATELGVASIQPLITERSVLRLTGERAEKKVAHWQSVAIAACEQCRGNRVPVVHQIMAFTAWIKVQPDNRAGSAIVLSLQPGSTSLRSAVDVPHRYASSSTTLLSGPEGGLNATEEDAALRCGYVPVSLGRRVLRAETAALAALAVLLVH